MYTPRRMDMLETTATDPTTTTRYTQHQLFPPILLMGFERDAWLGTRCVSPRTFGIGGRSEGENEGGLETMRGVYMRHQQPAAKYRIRKKKPKKKKKRKRKNITGENGSRGFRYFYTQVDVT